MKDSGYVNEDYVIALARNAGFELAARSEINANPKDTTDYPKGVWTLPPTLRLKDQDRDQYLAIGESDRMTLKFVKPEDARRCKRFRHFLQERAMEIGSASCRERVWQDV